jgi:hypothetical protein
MSWKTLRWLLIGLGALLLLAVGTLALLPLLLDTRTMQAYIAQIATHAVGRPVRFTSVSVSLLPLPHVNLKDLEIADDPRFGTAPLLRVGEVRVGVRVKPLLSLRIELASITLQDAWVELVEQGGRWNFASLAGATTASPPRPATRTVPGIPGSASMGSVIVSSVGLKNAVVNVRRHGVRNGDLRIEGLDATVSGVGGSELDVRGDARLEPGGLRLRNIRASVGIRAASEMPVKASFELESMDVAPLGRALLVTPPSISGPIKGRIQLAGTTSRLTGTGALDLSRLTVSEERRQCPPPVRRQLIVDEVHLPILLKPTSFESAPVSAKLSKGTIAANVTAGLGASPLVTITDIKIAGVQLQPVLQDYLCQGFAVSGPLDLGGELSMRTADMLGTMNGAGRFRIGAGRVVGEGALKIVREVLEAGNVFDMALRGKLAGPSKAALDFDSITGSYKIVNGIARTDDLLYQGKDLRVAVAGTYALVDGRTDMKVVATQGRNQLRAQVMGSGGALRVVPTGVNVKEPAEVRKLLDRLLR